MKTLTGLDRLIGGNYEDLSGKNVSLVCNQATISSELEHILHHFISAQKAGLLKIKSVFGPQHGLWGHTQDNMIEWEGGVDSRFDFPIYSLYGTHREPTDEMLDGSDVVVIDLPDVGSRYYTFIWTMALCLKKCQERGIPVLLLDRPNPIGGDHVEGSVLDPKFASFVGLYPLPIRHGMTLGEIANYLATTYFPKVDLKIERCDNWQREQSFQSTGLPWPMPSPNLPTLDSALVYPGGCLIEGTMLSEGRGTTKPFEIIGAPFIDAWDWTNALNSLDLPGVHFRPYQFEPTFQKHAGAICEGVCVDVVDRSSFKPFLTYTGIIREAYRMYPSSFEWKSPPYEYEFDKMPIDILAGNSWFREAIEQGDTLERIEERTIDELAVFAPIRERALLYK